MSFASLSAQQQGITLLQRSLERGRLAHAYLFTGHDLGNLELLGRTLAKTLSCLKPTRRQGRAVDCCDACATCQRIDADGHADVHWVRPESKSRSILIEQIRDLMGEIHLKPNEAEFKVAIISGADRMNAQGANAFLKTLEEPPPKSVIILLTAEPQQLLDTVLSRCLRLNFGGEGMGRFTEEQLNWLRHFGELAANGQGSVLARYRLLDALLQQLRAVRDRVEKILSERSPLSRYGDVEPETRERWEDELEAAIESEYRRQRADLISLLQWWCRDVWLRTLRAEKQLLSFADLDTTARTAQRVSTRSALANMTLLDQVQRLLRTNVQEALALEVSLLRMQF
jgi:DNA polymerase-3 subunit delta'